MVLAMYKFLDLDIAFRPSPAQSCSQDLTYFTKFGLNVSLTGRFKIVEFVRTRRVDLSLSNQGLCSVPKMSLNTSPYF